MQKLSFHPIDSLLNGHFDEEGSRNSFLEARQAFLQQAPALTSTVRPTPAVTTNATTTITTTATNSANTANTTGATVATAVTAVTAVTTTTTGAIGEGVPAARDYADTDCTELCPVAVSVMATAAEARVVNLWSATWARSVSPAFAGFLPAGSVRTVLCSTVQPPVYLVSIV
jgi:hypothetical protein